MGAVRMLLRSRESCMRGFEFSHSMEKAVLFLRTDQMQGAMSWIALVAIDYSQCNQCNVCVASAAHAQWQYGRGRVAGC